MSATLPLSEIRSTNGLAGRLRRDVCAADPIVTAGVPTLSRDSASTGGVTASAAAPTTQTGTRSAGNVAPPVGPQVTALATVQNYATVGRDRLQSNAGYAMPNSRKAYGEDAGVTSVGGEQPATLSQPRIPASDQRQEGQPARPVAAPSDLGLAMQPFDLTQCAYAVETVLPGLREQDEAHQALVVMVGPSAVITARQAKAFHVAISNVAVLGELAERLALYPDLLTVLQHLERGDSVRIAITANSTGTVTEFVGEGDVVAFAPIERVA